MSGIMRMPEPSSSGPPINLDGKYTPIQKIGEGSYGEVWLITDNHSSSTKARPKRYVAKRINLNRSPKPPTQKDIELAESEGNLLSKLKHPNIVPFIETFRSSDGIFNLILGYCDGGDLYHKIKEKEASNEILPEEQIVEWFIQICLAIQYLHGQGIIHRDLKTQNIFLTKTEIIKVGDFGIAKVLQSKTDFAMTMIGTPYYMSPEIWNHKPYGFKSDIWALGCCVYEMTSYQFAFDANDIETLCVKVVRGKVPEIPNNYSESLASIVAAMLKANPDDRPSASELLQDPYIQQNARKLLEKTQNRGQDFNHTKNRRKSGISPSTVTDYTRHNQQLFSSDEQDPSFNRRSYDQPRLDSQPPPITPRKASIESKESPLRNSFESEARKSFEPNQQGLSSARLRRRNRLNSSNRERSPAKESSSLTQDNATEEVEKNKEREEDMTNLVLKLQDTLRLPYANHLRAEKSPYPTVQNEPSHDNFFPVVNKNLSSTLNESNRIYQRHQELRESCLREIDENRLRRVLQQLNGDDENIMMQAIFNEIDERLFNKHSKNIYLLKFYEDILHG